MAGVLQHARDCVDLDDMVEVWCFTKLVDFLGWFTNGLVVAIGILNTVQG
jgi:hypothetical protein